MKATLTIANPYVSGKNAKPPPPKDKLKKIVPICHFCNMPSHIHPKCFKYKNTFRMNRMKQPYYKPRTAPKHKINLKNKFINKIWVKKSDLNCCVASNSLNAVSTDS